jgi:hypothetical protein
MCLQPANISLAIEKNSGKNLSSYLFGFELFLEGVSSYNKNSRRGVTAMTGSTDPIRILSALSAFCGLVFLLINTPE